MIYLISSIIALILNRRRRYGITLFMLWLFLASSICAFIVGRQHTWEADSIMLIVFTTIVLFIIFFSYHKYSNIQRINFEDVNVQKLDDFEKYITIAAVIIIFIEIYVLYNVMGLMLIGMTDVAEFKNGDGDEQTAIYDSVIPHIYLTLCHFLSPVGYIFLSLHFYYLIISNYKKASKYLFLSLILVFHGLIGLSRSATVVFIITYTCIFFFSMPLLDKKVRKKYLKVFTIVLIVVGTLLMIISNSRFSDIYTKNSKNDALLDEHEHPVLFSMIDYFAMWNENGLEFMKRRPDGLMYYGWYNSAGLPIMIDYKLFGNSKIYEEREKEIDNVLHSKVGDLWFQFHGCVARLTYEWGYFGTILFVLFFYFIMQKLSPQKGVLRFRDILCLPLLTPMGLTFWCGIGIGGLDVQMGMVYGIFFYLLISNKRKKNRYSLVTSVK